MPAKKKQQASAAEQNTTKKVKPAAVEAEPAEVNEVTQVTVAPKKKNPVCRFRSYPVYCHGRTCGGDRVAVKGARGEQGFGCARCHTAVFGYFVGLQK